MNRLVLTDSYNIGLSSLLGSIVPSVMMEEILKIWKEKGKHSFYVFLKPCDNEKYQNGNSWKEKKGLSADDVKYGLSFIGTRITDKNKRDVIMNDVRPNFDTKGKLLNANHLVIYFQKNGVTHYELNEELIENAVSVFFSGEWKNYIGPPPIEVEEKPRMTEEEAMEISAFADKIILPQR